MGKSAGAADPDGSSTGSLRGVLGIGLTGFFVSCGMKSGKGGRSVCCTEGGGISEVLFVWFGSVWLGIYLILSYFPDYEAKRDYS